MRSQVEIFDSQPALPHVINCMRTINSLQFPGPAIVDEEIKRAALRSRQ